MPVSGNDDSNLSDLPDVSFNGKFINSIANGDYQAISDNGIYACSYKVADASDEIRRLTDFVFYVNGQKSYNLAEAPGSDLTITDSGIAVFYDHSNHFNGSLTINAIADDGRQLISKAYQYADGFEFSAMGNHLAVRHNDGIEFVSLQTGQTAIYPSGDQFTLSEDARYLAIANQGSISVYDDNNLKMNILSSIQYPRKLVVSSNHNLIAIINKRTLRAYELTTGVFMFEKSLTGDLSYRDLKIDDGVIYAGIHRKTKSVSEGILRSYSIAGELLYEHAGARKTLPVMNAKPVNDQSATDYDPVSWPFEPFDSVCMVWNYYEQHMGGFNEDFSYLHQGLDMITPIEEPTYAIQAGIVKCVLTLGGDLYWRLAISPVQSDGVSSGWLYAHLVENSIQVDIGDTVELYDYLGDIVMWTPEYGHIHFVEITDTGSVWYYFDNEWGINFNPLLALQPIEDSSDPVFENVFPDSKFAICLNESSDYLMPDSIYGEVDIICKVYDYLDNSPYQLPPFATYYWITRNPEGDTAVSRRMGHILNHGYDFYDSDPYEPYARLIYKHDNVLEPSSWNNIERNYYPIVTNSNGDSLVTLDEAGLALNTAMFSDGSYTIFIDAVDRAGNSTVESMEVGFYNGVTSIKAAQVLPSEPVLYANYPNPFNSMTMIPFSLPSESRVAICVYNVYGQKVAKLADRIFSSGIHSIRFDCADLASGTYFCRLESHNVVKHIKMLLVR